MISFTVSKDQNTAVLDFNGRVTRLHAVKSDKCGICELHLQTDNCGAHVCRLLYWTSPGNSRSCTDRHDGRSISWKKIPERRPRNA